MRCGNQKQNAANEDTDDMTGTGRKNTVVQNAVLSYALQTILQSRVLSCDNGFWLSESYLTTTHLRAV